MSRMPRVLSAFLLVGLFSICNTSRAGDLDNLFQLRDARTRRVSSSDPNWQNGNADARPLRAGQTLTIADIKGPGIIRHIWFTIAADDRHYGRSLTLRMYWNGEKEPAVESPIGDFFAVGHGELKNVTSLPVAVSSEGRGKNCYWPMPFENGARITLTNDSPNKNVPAVYFYVDYEEVDSLPKDTANFHAQYRQEYPAEMGKDYLILDAEGRGHYVGTVLSVVSRTPGWFGEGDDRFYIDGDAEPTLRGTGTEDYFCDGWGFSDIQRPFYGVVFSKWNDLGDKIGVYRWHINDPIHFTKSLKVTIEHKGEAFTDMKTGISGFMERQDLFSSVAFWYQTGIAKRYTTLPPADQRVLPERTIRLTDFVADAKPQPADTAVDAQQLENKRNSPKRIYAQFTKPDGVLTVPLKLDQPLQGIVTLDLTKAPDYGTWRVSLDGKPLPSLDPVDLFSTDIELSQYKLGYLSLPVGAHELKFQCVGKNASSKGYFLGADAIEVEELTPYFVKGK